VLETDEPRMDMIDALREEEQPGTPIGGVEKTKSTLTQSTSADGLNSLYCVSG
jgi:hypothetical protein